MERKMGKDKTNTVLKVQNIRVVPVVNLGGRKKKEKKNGETHTR